MKDDLDSILTYYHPLCEINIDNIDSQSKDRICPRSAIKILTYNICLLPPPLNTNENDWKDERMNEFIKYFPQFDIICLQELFGLLNNRKHDLIRFAVKSGFFFFVDSPSPSFLSKYLADGGLVILSRFPIIESAFIPFKYGVLSDSLAQKGVLYAQIQIKNSILHLFTTHLQASYFGSTEYEWVKIHIFRMFPILPE
jgi:endonuclease/exonuclease/phosphatase family metal-dependent hydrolase